MKASKSFSATLQLVSDTMPAAKMAEVLGEIDGAVLLEKGQKTSDRPGSRPMAASIWRLESKLPKDSQLSDHIISLLAVVENKADQFRSLLTECDADMRCFVSFDESQCGLEFDHRLIQRLSALSISLILDIYS